jgi:dynein heavy chain
LEEFEEFFKADGRASLLFFYKPPEETEASVKAGATPAYNANGRRLWITNGRDDEYTGTCLFFLRTNTQKPISLLNIHMVRAVQTA